MSWAVKYVVIIASPAPSNFSIKRFQAMQLSEKTKISAAVIYQARYFESIKSVDATIDPIIIIYIEQAMLIVVLLMCDTIKVPKSNIITAQIATEATLPRLIFLCLRK